MNWKIYNLYMLVFWLFVGLGLLLRNLFLPDQYRTPDWEQRLNILCIGAFVFATWNMIRWYSSRQARVAREAWKQEYSRRVGPLAEKDPPQVVNPEFDFNKPDSPPEPPRNGKHS